MVAPSSNEWVQVQYKHSPEIRATISAANKGRRPWNAGKSHSEETKRKIAARTAAGIARKLEAEAAMLGITVESLREMKSKRRNAAQAQRPRVAEARRKRRSAVMKRAWKNPVYRARFLARSRVVNPETRARISQRLKEFWAQHPAQPKPQRSSSPTAKQGRSEKMRQKWRNPVFRTKMLASFFERRHKQWRRMLSRAIQQKWKDPHHRYRVLKSSRNSDSHNHLSHPLEEEVSNQSVPIESPVSSASGSVDTCSVDPFEQQGLHQLSVKTSVIMPVQAIPVDDEPWTEPPSVQVTPATPTTNGVSPPIDHMPCSLAAALEAVREARRTDGRVALHGDQLKLQTVDGEEIGGELDEEERLNRLEDEAGNEYIIALDGDDIRVYSMEEYARLDPDDIFAT